MLCLKLSYVPSLDLPFVHFVNQRQANQTLSAFKFFRPLILTRIDSPFVETLDILYKNKISGLAMVDHEFHLRGNFSASDLRVCCDESLLTVHVLR